VLVPAQSCFLKSIEFRRSQRCVGCSAHSALLGCSCHLHCTKMTSQAQNCPTGKYYLNYLHACFCGYRSSNPKANDAPWNTHLMVLSGTILERLLCAASAIKCPWDDQTLTLYCMEIHMPRTSLASCRLLQKNVLADRPTETQDIPHIFPCEHDFCDKCS